MHSFGEGASFIEIPIVGISSLGFCALSWQRKLCAHFCCSYSLEYLDTKDVSPNTPVPQFVLCISQLIKIYCQFTLFSYLLYQMKYCSWSLATFCGLWVSFGPNSFSLSPLHMLMWLHDDSCSRVYD